MATEIDIEKTRGDTRRHIFLVKDKAGSVVDISAWTIFKLTITSIKAPPDATTLEEVMSGSLVTDGSDGRVGYTPAGTLDIGKHFYDTEALDENSELITFAEGEYVVTQDRGK
ncbi:MAG: hypothetical protein DRH08_01045 [Deltaproteobacteria bacterium]|nr:MAG: hypothetical protein DRH08_01045 [Deltaproteobacteria bacterium]